MAVKGIAIHKNPKNEAKPMLQQAKWNAATKKIPPIQRGEADVAASEEGSHGRERLRVSESNGSLLTLPSVSRLEQSSIPIPQRGWKNPCMSA